MTLDHLSGGRLNVGLGAGTDGYDAQMLGQPALGPGRRHARFVEFVDVLDRVLSQPETTWSGDWYTVEGARTIPPCVAATAPAVRRGGQRTEGDATGPRTRRRLGDDHGCAARRDPRGLVGLGGGQGRHVRRAVADGADVPDGFARYLNLEARTSGFSSAEEFVDAVGRAAALGFTDVVLAWPRPEGAFAGNPALIEAVAARLPELHAL